MVFWSLGHQSKTSEEQSRGIELIRFAVVALRSSSDLACREATAQRPPCSIARGLYFGIEGSYASTGGGKPP